MRNHTRLPELPCETRFGGCMDMVKDVLQFRRHLASHLLLLEDGEYVDDMLVQVQCFQQRNRQICNCCIHLLFCSPSEP